MSFARNLRIDTHVVEGPDIAAAIADFARSQRITQIFMGRAGPAPFLKRLKRERGATGSPPGARQADHDCGRAGVGQSKSEGRAKHEDAGQETAGGDRRRYGGRYRFEWTTR